MPPMTSGCWACSAAGPEPGPQPSRRRARPQTRLPAHHNERRQASRPTQITQSGAAPASDAPPRHEVQNNWTDLLCGRTKTNLLSVTNDLREPPSLGQQGLRLQSDHAAWTSCRTVSLALDPVRGRSRRGLRIVNDAGQSALCWVARGNYRNAGYVKSIAAAPARRGGAAAEAARRCYGGRFSMSGARWHWCALWPGPARRSPVLWAGRPGRPCGGGPRPGPAA
jgi:hypothetical protein